MINTEIINEAISDKKKSTKNKSDDKEVCVNSVRRECLCNVVSEERLKEVQLNTLSTLKNYLSKTYGPMGSYTSIISGSGPENMVTTYSKDGLKVMKNIYFDSPIEVSICAELIEICAYVEHMVGDGTTSAVIISSLIYDGLYELTKNSNLPPRKIVKEFSNIVETLKKLILSKKKDVTLNDIYDIAMISTNGNEIVSDQITSLYKEYGFNVNIDVNISNDTDTKVKIYDGLTINEGYSDPAYINNVAKGTADIRDAKIYAFQDPVDTPEMITFFEKIIIDNIFMPLQSKKDCVPTVIVCPMISRDGNGVLTKLIEALHEYSSNNIHNMKPPILILTNIHGTDEEIAMDITRLCNCKYIRKYINPDVQKHDQETGNAPTLETIHDFAGTCELVSADAEKAKFINPYDVTENGGKIYSQIVEFLKSEIENAKSVNEDKVTIGRLKKRLRCLEANMIEFLVGGISISDRDSLKDLVEDAVKNCASACEHGVGRAANFEGLQAAYTMMVNMSDKDDISYDIIKIIFKAYYDAAKILYGTILPEDEVDDTIIKSLNNNGPFNVAELFNNDGNTDIKYTNVLSSIMTDVEVLNAISKIVTMMATSNQCLLQTTTLNRY